jgi:hypothetical protein
MGVKNTALRLLCECSSTFLVFAFFRSEVVFIVRACAVGQSTEPWSTIVDDVQEVVRLSSLIIRTFLWWVN